jgi:hypothetical protein
VSTKGKVLIGFGVWLLGAILLVALLGSEGKNEEFTPTDEFKLDPWISIELGGIDPASTRRCSTSCSPAG